MFCIMGIFNILKKKRPLEDSEDFERDLHSVLSFLANLGRDVKEVHDLGVRVRKLRMEERCEVSDKKQIKLLENEIKAWDSFLEKFVMFDRDVDVAGARVKKISKVLREEAEKMPIQKEVKEMTKKKDEWVFNW